VINSFITPECEPLGKGSVIAINFPNLSEQKTNSSFIPAKAEKGGINFNSINICPRLARFQKYPEMYTYVDKYAFVDNYNSPAAP
jgi:hypothetical protein